MPTPVIARSEADEAIQGALIALDCFAEPVIGGACADRWLAMTTTGSIDGSVRLLLHGFAVLMTWKTLALMMVGWCSAFSSACCGAWRPNGVAILLPLTFTMDRPRRS